MLDLSRPIKLFSVEALRKLFWVYCLGFLCGELLTLRKLAASPGFAEAIETAVQESIAHFDS